VKLICQVGIVAREIPTRSCFFVPRERAGLQEIRRARLANRGVPGGCCYLEVLVLVVSFPYILALLKYPTPSG